MEIFRVTSAGLEHEGAVSVGLEPVAVAARRADEVWVVNHLSDSISVVDASADPPWVARTLLVGLVYVIDESIAEGEHGEYDGRGTEMVNEAPDKPLQQTRASMPIELREVARSGPRG